MKNVLFMQHEELTSRSPTAYSKSNEGSLIIHSIFAHQAAIYIQNKTVHKIDINVLQLCEHAISKFK